MTPQTIKIAFRSGDRLRDIARKFYENDDVRINERGRIARTPNGGAWVSAWVYVEPPGAEE
jgi:hypothetical protein